MSTVGQTATRAHRGARACALALAFVGAWGCGGVSSDADRHALYAALQRAEARATAAEHAALEEGCDARPHSCDEACEASHTAADIAGRIGERDASVRAERTERACVWCRSERCEPPSSSETP